MIFLKAKNPTTLWLNLGDAFFRYRGIIDCEIAKRRFISKMNILEIEEWSLNWTGKAILDLVGYSKRGSKLKTLRNTYIDEQRFTLLKKIVQNIIKDKSKGYFVTGMNFTMQVVKKGKGGCLSSFHVIRGMDGEWEINIHAKTAEIPRKFAADMVMVANMIRELNLPVKKVKVVFMLTSMYFSIISLRVYVKLLGLKKKDFRGLPIMEPRNYQKNAWQAIEEFAKTLGKGPVWKKLNLERGEWK